MCVDELYNGSLRGQIQAGEHLLQLRTLTPSATECLFLTNTVKIPDFQHFTYIVP
jgi:hypothetical protein